jgi:glycosyltransferase involved in cell wall biosynthesis
MKLKYVSIICPIYNEENYIEQCIHSILSQDYPKDYLEFFLVDGMSTDKTREKVEEYCKKFDFIKLFSNPHKVVPHALNIGIKESRGEVIIRIDAHCEYPSNYVSTLVHYLFELNADNVGAVLNTLPAKNNSICRAIALGSSHKFGVGNSIYKVGATEIMETDTVPFGCYRREIFDRIGLFDEELTRNQDDEFNGRLIKSGGKIFLIPHLVIDYTARESIKKMSKMYYQYGLFKPLVTKKLGTPATIRQFFPVAFVLGLLIGAILSCFSKILLIIYLFTVVFYIGIANYFSVQNALKKNDWKLILILPVVFFIIHTSYGFGYLVGIYKIIFKKKFTAQVNR